MTWNGPGSIIEGERQDRKKAGKMGLLAKLSGQQQDLIKWDSSDSDALLFKVNNNRQLIKNGALLHVDTDQRALLVSKSTAADVFEAGIHTLDAASMPKLIKIQSLDKSYAGPFIAEIVYFNLPAFGHIRWNSVYPVEYIDPEYGKIQLRLRGNIALELVQPGLLLEALVRNQAGLYSMEIKNIISELIIKSVCAAFRAESVRLSEAESKLEQIEQISAAALGKEFLAIGLGLNSMQITHVSTPDSWQSISIHQKGDKNAQASQSKSPPPLPNEIMFYTAEDGKQQGPFNFSDIAARFASGKITAESYVWTDGQENWQKAGRVESLKAYIK